MAGENEPTTPGTPSTPQGHPLFPHTLGGEVDNSAPGPAAAPPSPAEQQIAALQQQFEQQQQAWNQREQFYQQQMDVLMQRGYQPSAPAAPAAAPELPGFDDLPDPITNPKAYNEALTRRIAEREGMLVQSVQQNVQQSVLGEVSRAQALDSLWNRLGAQHPDLAKRTALAQGAAAVTFNELRMRGVDPVAVAQQNPDSLIGSIVTRMQAELGTAGTQPTTPGTPGGAARTEGIAGGSTPGGAAPTAPAKAPSFVDQLRKAQVDLGIM